MEEIQFKFFPWENGESPYFTNEEGFDWYIDKMLTDYARRKSDGSVPLKAVCFFVVKDGELMSRVLVGEQQNILHEDNSLEGMSVKIDILRLAGMMK